MTVNVYEQYFEADLMANGVLRRGALVMLIADSEAGHIRYEAARAAGPKSGRRSCWWACRGRSTLWPRPQAARSIGIGPSGKPGEAEKAPS